MIFTLGARASDTYGAMFREVAIVTASAAAIGTGAATLSNASEDGSIPKAPPAIERAPASAPVEGSKRPTRPDPDLVAFGPVAPR
jgi:hypothetical protein